MDFNSNYTTDQVFVNPLDSLYPSYINSVVQPKNNMQDYNISSISRNENGRSNNVPFIPEENLRMRHMAPRYNDVYDYLDRSAKSYNDENSIIDDLRKKISEYKYKHDIFLIFIICLVVYIIIQHNSANNRQMLFHYDAYGSIPMPMRPMQPMMAMPQMPVPAAPV